MVKTTTLTPTTTVMVVAVVVNNTKTKMRSFVSKDSYVFALLLPLNVQLVNANI
jgi:hypothetical protein